MIYRDYRPGDFEALCEIDRQCFEAGVAYPPQDLSYWLELPGSFAIVAEDANTGKAGAFILARTARSLGHIVTIDVLPAYRRAGVATELMQRAHVRLEEMGATRASLETAADNEPAIAFYQKLGYRVQRRLPRYYLDRIDAWVMTKDL